MFGWFNAIILVWEVFFVAKKIKNLETPNLNQTLTPELLGQAIKARRTQSNLRLEDAAALSGVAKQTLANLEHGQSITSQFGSVLQVCAALGIELAILPWQSNDGVKDDWQ